MAGVDHLQANKNLISRDVGMYLEKGSCDQTLPQKVIDQSYLFYQFCVL